MRTNVSIATCGALAMAFAWCGIAPAADVEVQIGGKKVVDVQVNKDKAAADDARDEKGATVKKAGDNIEVETVYRAAKINGMAVENREKESLGKIEDLVLDLQSGEIKYAALSFGGVLGLGDKLFAIPWSAVTLRATEDGHVFVLNVEKERLKQAAGFDQDHWPNTADPKWHADTLRFYAESNKQDDKTAKPKDTSTPDYSSVMRVSAVTGIKVQNDEQQDLGQVEELMIDINKGRVRYAALSFGGVLGIGDKLFAIPWHAMELKQNEDNKFFVLNVSKERLERAPGFNKDSWPDTANPNWNEEIDAYYQAKRAAAVKP